LKFSLDELLHRKDRGQLDEISQLEIEQPFVVKADFGLVAVEDAKGLLRISARIVLGLFFAEHGAQLVLVGRIAHHARARADEKRHLVAQVLELAQLAHGDGVAQVQVGRARVVAAIDAQRAALLQPLAQLGGHGRFKLVVAVFGALHQQGDLLIEVKVCIHVVSESLNSLHRQC